MAKRSKRWTRTELMARLDTTWVTYPQRLQALSQDQQARFAQQQGYARPQDLLAHLGAWLEETRRVMPYLQRAERPPRDYGNDAQFNVHAVERWAAHRRDEVETWYEQQRLALRQTILALTDEVLTQPRVYRWLVGTIVKHYDEHPLP